MKRESMGWRASESKRDKGGRDGMHAWAWGKGGGGVLTW
jgi:hypothetical protein